MKFIGFDRACLVSSVHMEVRVGDGVSMYVCTSDISRTHRDTDSEE